MFIQDWASLVVGSLQNLWAGAISTLGDIVGALLILIIGLVVASGLGSLVERLVGMLRLDRAMQKMGVEEHFDRAGLRLNSAKFFGQMVYWFLVVVFLLAATDILRFYSLSNFLREVLLYIPNVFVAVLIMLAAVVLGNLARRLVHAGVKSAKLHAAGFLGTLTWWSVVVFGLFAALTQLGVAVGLIQTLVTGLVAMLALAGGIAFGLGGKDYAASLLSRLRERVE